MSVTGSSVLPVPFDLSSIIIQALATIAVQSAFYGVFVVVMFFSTYFLCCKGFKTKANAMTLSVTTIIFATSTIYWAFTLTISTMSVRALYRPEQITLQESKFIGGLYIAQMYLPLLNVCIFSATLLLPGSFVSAVASIVYKVKGFTSHATGSLFVAWVLCLATNVIATGLIAFKAWQHRRSIKAYLVHEGSRRRPTEKILALLVESGALYCGLWVLIIMTRSSTISAPECELIEDASVQIAGIYPTVVVVLVTLQKTAWDEHDEHPHMKTTDMQVARRPTLPTHHSTRHQRSTGVDQIESHRSADSSDDGCQDATSSVQCALSSTTDPRASAVPGFSPAESPVANGVETYQRAGLRG